MHYSAVIKLFIKHLRDFQCPRSVTLILRHTGPGDLLIVLIYMAWPGRFRMLMKLTQHGSVNCSYIWLGLEEGC